MSRYVLKYGGTSVGTANRIKKVAQQLVDRAAEGQELIVVVSAMGNTTNDLIAQATKVNDHPDKRDLDMLLSTGEMVSISLLSMAIKQLGGDSICLTGFQAGIETDEMHTKARIGDINGTRIDRHLNEGKIVVVAGFQGINEEGDITTLGRGGSDTTAVSLAAVFECPCEIYTDVDGVYTTDPRVYPEAKKLDVVSYEEMLEMASLGAKVLETRAVEMAHKYKVPLYVALNTGKVKGTTIKEIDETMESKVVTGLTLSDNCVMVTLNNVPYESKNIATVFAKLAGKAVNVDMISQTAPVDGHVALTFTGLEEDLENIQSSMSELKSESFKDLQYEIDDSVVKLSVVGIGMISQSGVAASLFDIFANNNINFYQVTTSEISISYTVKKEDRDKAVRLVAYKFDL